MKKEILFICIVLLFSGIPAKISASVLNYPENNVPVLIFYKEGNNQYYINFLSSNDIRIKHVYKHLPIVYAEVPKQKIPLLENDKSIEYISTDTKYYPLLQDSVPLIGAVNLTYGNLSLNGSNITIAVLDTGIDYNHPDLNGSVLLNASYDFVNNDNDPMDDYGHGTHVAGIIAAHGNLTGVAPGAKLIAVKVCDLYGCLLSDILKGMDWAIDHNADVASLSLGSIPIYYSTTYDSWWTELPDGNDVLSLALTYLSDKIIPVIAAGNSYMYGITSSPGNGVGVITVGATDKNDTLASFSIKGLVPPGRVKPDLTAPGVGINSTCINTSSICNNSTYSLMSGTSMATPHVSGGVALLLQAHPEWKGNTSLIKTVLREGADYLPGYYPSEVGSGRLNVSGSINLPVLILPYEVDVDVSRGTNTTYSIILKKLVSGNLTVNVSVVPARLINTVRCSNITYDLITVPSQLNLTENQTSISLNITVPLNLSAGYYEGYIIFKPTTYKEIAVPYVISVPGDNNSSLVFCGSSVMFGNAESYYDSFYVNLNLNTSIKKVVIQLNDSPEYMFITGPEGAAYHFSDITNTTVFSFKPWINGTYVLTILPNKTISGNIIFIPLSLNISPSELHYIVFAHDNKTKVITIKNEFNSTINISLDYIPSTTEQVLFDSTNFTLNPGNQINISVTLITNDSTLYGRHVGWIVVNYTEISSNTSSTEILPLIFNVILPINTSYYMSFYAPNGTDPVFEKYNGFYISQPDYVKSYTVLMNSSCYWSLYLYDVENNRMHNISISPIYLKKVATNHSGLWYFDLFTDNLNCALYINISGKYLPWIYLLNQSNIPANNFLPGDNITITAFAYSETGYNITEPGSLKILYPNNTTFLEVNVSFPFNYTFQIPNNSVSGTWKIIVNGTNYIAENTTTYNVAQVPTSIVVDVLPGVIINKSINITVDLLDQDGEVIFNRTLRLQIIYPNSSTEFFNVSSGIPLIFNNTTLLGTYRLNVSFDNISNSSSFLVDVLKEIWISTNDTELNATEPLNLSIVLLNNTNITNFSGNISMVVEDVEIILTSPNNTTYNYTETIYGYENVSIQLPSHPLAGNWTVEVYDEFTNISSNVVSFNVFTEFSYSVDGLYSNYNVSINQLAPICFNITNTGNDFDNFTVYVQNLSWNYTVSESSFTLYPQETKRLCVNITVPFMPANTSNVFTIFITTQTYQKNHSQNISLKVLPYIDFEITADNTSFSNFQIPDTLRSTLTVRNTGNVQINISCNFSGGTYITPISDYSIVLNMLENTSKVLNFTVNVGAYEDEILTMNCSYGNVSRSLVFTFSPPRLTVSVSTPSTTDTYYPDTGTVKIPLTVKYSGTDVSFSEISFSECIIRNASSQNITGTLTGSGTSIFCEFNNLQNWNEGEYLVSVELRDTSNRTGKGSGYVFIPKEISGGSISLTDSSVCVGEGTILEGKDFLYSSGHYVYGVVVVYVGNTKIGTETVTNGNFDVYIPGQNTPGTYTVKATVYGVWGISTTLSRSLYVYNCSNTQSSGGSGGGGGGGSIESLERIALEKIEEPSSYLDALNPMNISLHMSGLIGNYSVNVTENSSYQHFFIQYPKEVSLNGDDIVNVTIVPFRYVKPGNYTIKVMVGNHVKEVNISIPHPEINKSKINVFRYVEYYSYAKITKMYIEVINPLNTTKKIQVVENISKNIVKDANQVIKFGKWVVLEQDPVIAYNLTLDPGDSEYIRYNLPGYFVNETFEEPKIIFLENKTSNTSQEVSEENNVLSGSVSTPEVEEKVAKGKEQTITTPESENTEGNPLLLVVVLVVGFGILIIFLIIKGRKHWKEKEKIEFTQSPEEKKSPVDKLFEKP